MEWPMQVQMNDVTLLGSFFRGVPRYDRGSVSNVTQKQLVATAVPALQQTPPGASSDIFTQCTDIKALAAASGRAKVAWFTAIPSEPPACQASAPNNVVSTPLPLCANRCGPDAEAKWTLWRPHFGMHSHWLSGGQDRGTGLALAVWVQQPRHKHRCWGQLGQHRSARASCRLLQLWQGLTGSRLLGKS